MALLVKIESPDLEKVTKLLKGVAISKAPEKAISDAINRSLVAGRAEASKKVRARYAISAGEVKGNLLLDKANYSKLHGALEYKGPHLPVELFKHTISFKAIERPPSMSRAQHRFSRKFQQFHVTIIKGNRKLIKGTFKAGASEFHGLGGRAYERKQPERYPVYRVMTIGLPYMMRQRGIVDDVEYKLREVYNSRLEHNIDAMLTGLWGARR